jgi:tRNA 2-selenouridine synthase
MATILSEVGWRTSVLHGGYHSWRRHVVDRLYDGRLDLKFIVIDGQTGTGKTDVLGRLVSAGAQVLDLEHLAVHRGSLFGALPGRPQPSQKMFESEMLGRLDGFDPARPVFVEAESSKVGERMVPPALWSNMAAAPRIELTAAPEARAAYLASVYRDVVADRARLDDVLARLPTPAGKKRRAAWGELADAGQWEALALELMELHYDPAYRRSAKRETRPRLGEVAMGVLGSADLDRAAEQVLKLAP